MSVILREFQARLTPLLCNRRRLHCSGTDVVELQGEAGIRSLSGRHREDPRKLHPPLGSSQLLGSSSTVTPQLQRNSSSLLQSAQWPGYGSQAYSPRFGPLGTTSRKHHGEQAEHEVAHRTSFTACWGSEFCRKSSNMMVTSSQP